MVTKKTMEVVKSLDLQHYMGRWYVDLVVDVSKLQQFFPPCLPLPFPPEEVNEVVIEVEREKDEGGMVGETFTDYRPPKLSISPHHLDPVVETSSLAAKHLQHLPNSERAGFFFGDEAGVGKGITIAGLIWENWHRGMRKAVISYSGFLPHPDPVMALDLSSLVSVRSFVSDFSI
ncbi:hypothetical protein C1H46_029891 [Malus baccata]|uniref:Strawberry notch AAA domain-containing protein n=1 Tax=Malus baccata TaxID=106549 RepID=A0A540LDK4_MALBA|nr:hypothetical protein C1H46_029891 [Malus baccata]